MLFSNSFYTIKHDVQGVYKDRGSKFIAFAFHVTSEESIKNNIQQLKKEHVGANHFCYAWRLGASMQAYRVNDDGEPANSAGKPIYAQIQSNNLTNILIVVVRYFGGTLLGVSGLINAYKNASIAALQNTQIIEQFILHQYSLVFAIEDMNAVMKLCKELDAQILEQDYLENYKIVFNIKKEFIDTLEEKIKHIYNSKLNYIKTL